jgi:hypothetical protein
LCFFGDIVDTIKDMQFHHTKLLQEREVNMNSRLITILRLKDVDELCIIKSMDLTNDLKKVKLDRLVL